MGCDIHLHIEIKINGMWEHYSCPSIPRWYDLFARMANVRNYDNITPISLPKGVPEDITLITKLAVNKWDGDGHNYSWLNAEEIYELMETDFVKKEWRFEHDSLGYLFGNGYGDWVIYPEEYPKEIEDIRFVFWFDN